jgi:hypothetical protein
MANSNEYLEALKNFKVKDPQGFEDFLNKYTWHKIVLMEHMVNIKDYSDIRLLQGMVSEANNIINYFSEGNRDV